QGVMDGDADLPSAREARLVGASPLGKLAWQLAFPLLQLARTARAGASGRGPSRAWLAANAALQLGADIALVVVLGPWPVVYLLASTLFGAALHPISARYVQEHTALGGPGSAQETFSYYGPGNLVALNLGYHNEHHDFPFVAWNRLPRVRRAAPEVYDALASHRSWTRLWWRFLADRRVSLFDRVVRERRGGPDAEA
ncbi:MAG: fatty acid desaturase, partial [Myxococcales bacterium]|nr:fatty acid desaturase [Myxococcales bacterium]